VIFLKHGLQSAIIMLYLLCLTAGLLSILPRPQTARAEDFLLGDERILGEYRHLLEGRRVGLITNPSGADREGKTTAAKFMEDPGIQLTALFGPEHGVDATIPAGDYVASYTHPQYNIPVYSLYGATRKPTPDMLSQVDVLVFDIQDIGGRSYTYISTLQYAIQASREQGKTVVVLDRPNPIGGIIVEGPMMEDTYQSFVGVDRLPMAHGMTVGELAQYFNRKIGADVQVVPMAGYTRDMLFEETGLAWIKTSPNIVDLTAARCYLATGLGEGTGVHQREYFSWIGAQDLSSQELADKMNASGLPGVVFQAKDYDAAGGVHLEITDPRTFNPSRTGFYALNYCYQLKPFKIPRGVKDKTMFEKIMGTDKVGAALEAGLSPEAMMAVFEPDLNAFREERKAYLIYGQNTGKNTADQASLPQQPQQPTASSPQLPSVPVTESIAVPAAPTDAANETDQNIQIIYEGELVPMDAPPILQNNRVLVPLRAVAEILGSSVQWDPDTRKVHVVKGDRTLEFEIGNQTVLINSRPRLMDTAPLIEQERVFIPLRFAAELLECKVLWDTVTKSVVIS
jgi:uncharacterized protein YbbC (DUF1343 family)